MPIAEVVFILGFHLVSAEQELFNSTQQRDSG